MKVFWLQLFLFSSFGLVGQNFLSWQMNDRYFSAQAGAGFSSYRGELKHNGSFQNEVSNLSLGLEARLLRKVSARIEVGRYQLRGHDKHAPDSSYARQRNLSFHSTNWEASLQGIFFLKSYHEAYHKRWQVDPYLMLGIGATYFSPKTHPLDSISYNLWELETEGTSYSRLTLIIPAGAGLKFKVNPFLNVIAEVTYRYTFSDYLDDVSTSFPETYPNALSAQFSNRKGEIEVVNQEAYDNLLIAGGPRGEPDNKDAYMFLNLKVEAFIPPGLFKGKKGSLWKKTTAR